MLRANSRTLPIEDIKIPEAFAQTTPGREKVDKAKQFYAVTGQFDHSILVGRNGYIFDGYARLTAAKELGLDKVPVVQIVPFKAKKKVDKPAEDEPKFKVGDKVKIVKARLSHKEKNVGDVVTIQTVNPNGDLFDGEIHYGVGNAYVWFENELEPYATPSFDWDAFKAGKIAVHCDTEEEAKAFLKECEKQGILWNSGDVPTDQLNFDVYDGGAYYDINNGSLFYDTKEWCEENGYTVIDYPFSEQPEQPTEQKEPIKLYCVKDHEYFVSVKSGDVISIDTNGIFRDRNGSTSGPYKSWDDFKWQNPNISACLVPLVKRTAKVGEYVLLNHDDCFRRNKQGDVVEVVTVSGRNSFIKDPTEKLSSGIYAFFEDEYTYVLDGYQPEPEPEAEKEPEYYNGKVVCVKADGYFTVGKVYEFCNGLVKSNTGDSYNKGEPIESFGDLSDGTWVPKFIEYKGEAND